MLEKIIYRQALRGVIGIFWVLVSWQVQALTCPQLEDVSLPPKCGSEELESCNVAAQNIIPAAACAIFEVSPAANDATLVLRFTTLITNSWYDATAPYHPTAKGVYSDIARLPQPVDNIELNIALSYASHKVLSGLFPHLVPEWDNLLVELGLDPNNLSEDTSTPVGVGNYAGRKVLEGRANDGMNQLGNEGDQLYHRLPYADYTDFKPANTAYKLLFPSLWQPAILMERPGVFRVQQFVTPQIALTTPYSYESPEEFTSPIPIKSQIWNYPNYVAQVNDVLATSANLTDEQKMKAELFDMKIFSLGFAAVFASESQGLSLMEFIHYDFLTNMAAFDTAIAIWKEKRRHNSVRPFSAVRYIYKDNPVTAWGGVGMGTVDDLPASQWTSYLPVADHPEYPSASASFCAAHAETSRLFLPQEDALGYTVLAPAGSSQIEPGITPQVDLSLTFPTWTAFEEDCGNSRVWGGVHFEPSVPAGRAIGHQVAQRAYQFYLSKVEGN
ncbi:vanadium-dependent haloperoxidase [Microbulbifer sp. SSSA002]|uniref:vanadium-dependent haloperoxidase n=1 Tax=unclassified Microbulbifer TaxID=2619833 RepID=UPI00403A5171